MLCLLAFDQSAWSQEKLQRTSSAYLCNGTEGQDIVQQQIGLSSTLNDAVQRIDILLHSADLIWPFQQDKARGAFATAFDLAVQHFNQDRRESPQGGMPAPQKKEQRYRVISAIAKRDLKWARELTQEVLLDEAKDAEGRSIKDTESGRRTAENLLIIAYSQLPSESVSALHFAKISLLYPATFQLSRFLYKLAETDRIAADSFYQRALTAYSSATMEQFLYLSSYPFGKNRDAGVMPTWSYYQVPNGFVPNLFLQRIFMQTLLRRASQMVLDGDNPARDVRISDAAQIWIALTRLESQTERDLPELSEAVQHAKVSIFALMSQKDRQRAEAILVPDPPVKSFSELIKVAERELDSVKREQLIALAILGSNSSEKLENVLTAAAKIDDERLRSKLLNWLYFERAQEAINKGELGAARQMAGKVDMIDQRSYLYSKIAEQSIDSTKNSMEDLELLEEVIAASMNSPSTEIQVRALLNVAYLFTKIDPNRSLVILRYAVTCLNKIDSPDFSQDYVTRAIEGKSFSVYATLRTPGFQPETAFREIGIYDLNATFYLAQSLADKHLRAKTMLALSDLCLRQARPQSRPKKVRRILARH
jgi:hypothetical protein